MNRDSVKVLPSVARQETRVVVYGRVGARMSAEADASSQFEACRAWCERNGYELTEAGDFR